MSGLDEARAYLAHPVLGPRLRECAELAAAVEGGSAAEVFGYPDDLKLRSSMTLFARAAPRTPVFAAVLDRYFDGEPDPRTLERLRMIRNESHSAVTTSGYVTRDGVTSPDGPSTPPGRRSTCAPAAPCETPGSVPAAGGPGRTGDRGPEQERRERIDPFGRTDRG